MKTVQFDSGCHIHRAAQMLVNACKTEDAAQGTFNDITLTADKMSTVEGIVVDFNTKFEAAAEAYRSSPKGKEAASEAEERKRKMQEKHDALMLQLPDLNFADDVAVLNWLCQFQDPSDYIGIEMQQDVVVATFANHGYYPNVNCNEDFNGNDRDNFARYIIGQALGGLTCWVGAIHPIIHKLMEDWRRKFLAEAA